jgi:hypothetical protein
MVGNCGAAELMWRAHGKSSMRTYEIANEYTNIVMQLSPDRTVSYGKGSVIFGVAA